MNKVRSVVHFSKTTLICSTILLLTMNACAPNLGASDYNISSVGEINTTLKGVIVAAKMIKIRKEHSDKPGVGSAVGGVSGAMLGSLVGGGNKMPLITGAVGGIAGGFAGHAIEKALIEQDGMEYHIKLADGSVITLTQGLEPKMSVGQKVLVIKSQRAKGRNRVVPDNN